MKPYSHIACVLALSMLAFTGCSDSKSELERQRELTREALQERKVDLSTPVVASAQHLFRDEAELTDICEEFMSHFGRGELDEAFDLLDQHVPWPKPEMKALRDQTKAQIQTIGPRFGRFRGHEKIRSEPIGSFLVRFLYLAKLENQPLRCTFLFYRADDRWKLIMFTWDDKASLIDP